MLIICPSCATSYMIDQTSVGGGGRTVRCARCKATWFAGGANPTPTASGNQAIRTAPNVNAFVDGVIAEAEAQAGGARAKKQVPAPQRESTSPSDHDGRGDDFGEDDEEEAQREPAKASSSSKPAAAPKPASAAKPASAPKSAPAPKSASAPKPAMPRAEPFSAAPEGTAPEQIDDAPSLVPPIEHEPFPDSDAADEPDERESFAARRERLKGRRKKSIRSSRWTAVLLVLIAFNVAVLGARNEVVRYLPQTASLFAAVGLPVNLRQLRFEEVRIAKETEAGVAILIVEGSIVSDASTVTEVPRLRFAARNTTGQEIYTWTMLPERSVLQPGGKLAFRSRLASPPADAQDVMVRFFTARDAEAAAGK